MKFALTDYSGRGSFLESFAFSRRFAPTIVFEEDNGAGGGLPPEPAAAKPDEDVSGLKSALAKERDRAKDFEKKFAQLQESFKGVDPEKYKQFETLQQQAEEANQREAQLRQNLESEYTGQIKQEQSKAQEWQQKFVALQKRTHVEKFFQATDGRMEAGEDGISFFDSIQTHADRHLRLSEKGELEVLDNNGVRRFSKKDASKPMSAIEYMEELKTHPVLGHCFKPMNNAKGGGMQPSANSRMGGMDTSNMSPAERLAYARSQKS